MYLFSGANDPVGDNSKGVMKVYNLYQKAGIQDISCKLYPDGRHEMLNETNRDEVYSDTIKWLDDHL